MSYPLSPSSGVDGSPVGYPCPPPLARTSTFTQATEETMSSTNAAYYASWEQSSDIRVDWTTGWGGDDNLDSGLHSLAVADARDSQNNEGDQWGWRLQNSAVRPVPAFYPMDSRSTRRIDLSGKINLEYDMEGTKTSESTNVSIEDVSYRISTACQRLSIHGVWGNMCPSAILSSMELVEMEINIHLGEAEQAASALSSTSRNQASPQVLLVEVQRRKGCPITFHHYRRWLLDAAEGTFDPDSFDKTDGLDKPFGRDRCKQPRISLSTRSLPGPSVMRLPRPSPPKRSTSAGGLARPSLNSLRIPSFSADDVPDQTAGLKTEGESCEDLKPSSTDVFDNSMKALNIAASLIQKDRIDARRLGIESLVLLTDPLRAGMETAQIASNVVLLGSAHGEAAICDDDVDGLLDASSGLGIREAILEMILMNDIVDTTSDDADGFKGIEKEFTDHLVNLCLTVLSNALHTIEKHAKSSLSSTEHYFRSNDGDHKGVATDCGASASSDLGVSKRFIDDTNSTFGCDVLASLLKILGQAKTNPHDAYHSARCLSVLFKCGGNSHRARAQRDLDAKRIISAALEVGTRSHAKLADASRQAMETLVVVNEESKEQEGDQIERTGIRYP